MSKPNVLVKISGDLIGQLAVRDWVQELTSGYSVTVIVGGGQQINNHFRQCHKHVQRFGPMGREINAMKDRLVAKDILEENRIVYQEYFDRYKIPVRVEIPVFYPGGNICHVNGDMYALLAYNGFDMIYIVTLPERAAEKKKYFSAVAESIAKGALEKITIKSFEAKSSHAGILT